MDDGSHGLAHRAQPDKAAAVVEQQLKKLRMEQREAAETKEQPEREEAALEEQRKKKEAALKKQQKLKEEDAQKWLQELMEEGIKKQREKEEAALEEERKQKEAELDEKREKRRKQREEKQLEEERDKEREKRRKEAEIGRKNHYVTELNKLGSSALIEEDMNVLLDRAQKSNEARMGSRGKRKAPENRGPQ